MDLAASCQRIDVVRIRIKQVRRFAETEQFYKFFA